ncbi:MAG TPA: IS630 family transposase [Dehalococcoidales bacterium]|nr:IS630 family transposase [Dehalococcoidales bacterium]
MIEKQLDELFSEMTLNTNSRARKKCWVVYLRKKGSRREEVAELLRIDEDTVTNYTKKYDESGLPGLLEENYRQPKSQLEPYTEQLKELFKKQVPHTVNQAIEMIDKEIGIRLKPSACRAFLKKMGMKCRRCGVVPGKAMEDERQRQAQQEFHDKTLMPYLDEAKQGKRTVLFVDAAHFVMGAFLGMVWCFVRLLLPSASGRKRHNVLGAYDPIAHEAITVTNDTYINQDVFCEFLEKISKAYADSGRPITLVLDNARYQKCPSVANKAKELNIELLYLPAYSPNLNLIERLWRFVKKQVLYSKHYDCFNTFRNSIDTCISDLGTRFKNEMQSLMTMNFQLF